MRIKLLLCVVCLFGPGSRCQEEEYELTPQDGWFNNLLHPDWGGIDGQLLRRSKTDYSDGVYHPSGQDRPNPFDISDEGHGFNPDDRPNASPTRPGLGSLRGRTAFMVFFGQQVVEEILDAQRPGCPREFMNIPVPRNRSHQFGNIEMPFFRSRYDQSTGYSPNNPRQQLNEITPYIDGGLMYGTSKAWTDAIRELSEEEGKRGRLAALDPGGNINSSFPAINNIRLPMANPPPPREHDLKPVARFWRLGNPRGNENPFLLSFGVLFFRWHNYWAKRISADHPRWNDEKVFNEARKWTIATYQKIVWYDWLPNWLHMEHNGTSLTMADMHPYKGYNPNIHPGITQEFQSAAMRFGHTLVTPGTWIRDKYGNFSVLKLNVPGQPGQAHAVRLCNAYWNPQEFLSSDGGLDKMLMGLASTIAEREDNIVVSDLREHLFGPLEFSRRDLIAINIQRARDHGLPGYNDVREAYGLPRKQSWDEINNYTITGHEYPNDKYMGEPISRLRALYGEEHLDSLDLFSGGLLETTPDGPGELFRTIIMDQFLRIRDGDRFWFENTANGLFSEQEVRTIMDITIIDVLTNVTNIAKEDINENPFIFGENDPEKFRQPDQLQADSDVRSSEVQGINETDIVIIENCTLVKHYDYFDGSQVSYALSFAAIGLFIPATIGVLILMARLRQRRIDEARRKSAPRKKETEPDTYLVVEWEGKTAGERNVRIKFEEPRKKLHVTDRRKKPLRMIDLRHTERVHLRLSDDRAHCMLSVRVPGEIDLMIRFSDQVYRSEFVQAFERFMKNLNIRLEQHDMSEKMMLDDAVTKEDRKKILDTFFRVVCLQAFKKKHTDMSMESLDAESVNEVSKIQLTRTEFADALGLKATSIFVRNMFLMVDKDRNGFVGFKEFMDMFLILARGGAEEKAQMLFNMYDLKSRGYLTPIEFTNMIKSMLDLSDTSIDSEQLQSLVATLYSNVGLDVKANMTFVNFKKIFASDEYEKTLENATLQLAGQSGRSSKMEDLAKSFRNRRKTFIDAYGGDEPGTSNGTATLERRKSRVTVKTKITEQPKTGFQKKLYAFTRYVENYRRQIFWLTLYILVSIGIFLERAFYYSFEREHVGLRRLAGYGVTVTRGAASGMIWTYTSLLVTMSRNTITFLRETFLHRFIPFDSFHAMHKFVAAEALFFTVMHVIGHAINFYHVSTWASTDLNCVFREYFRATDVLASFHYWAWGTITGLTGIILTLIVIVMYVFAMPYARRNVFAAFWFTHSFYILLYIFLIMHGTGRLVQAPITHFYLLGPLVLYVLDKLVSLSRKKVEISVKKAELLPSDVTALTFKRPLNFEYKSGQWVRIACLELGASEYHPFTLTSAPHEEHLSLHIRSVGPWTTNLRKTYDANNRDGKPFPKLYLDGPFGEGHQDWYRFKVAVLVGGGIGVTPFASILKDIVQKSKLAVRFPCEKVYFLWVTRTQKQFEWLTDIIKEVEENDPTRLVNVHIFITQFQQKFDLRTTMLYICERHFQKVCGKSLFTGLRAMTHFGRPQFEDFMKSLHYEHPKVNQIGVFSCGPPPMTLSVDRACAAVNKIENFPTYQHHFENF